VRDKRVAKSAARARIFAGWAPSRESASLQLPVAPLA